MQRPARQHHFVSQFYIRAFAVDPAAPVLFVVNLSTRKSYRTGTTRLAVENDFHTIAVEGHAPDAIEKALAQLEGAVDGAIRNIVVSASLANDEDKGLLLYYMSLLLVKSPFVRPKIDEMSGILAKTLGKAQAANKAAWDDQMAKDIAAGIYDKDFDGEAVRRAILEDTYTISMTTEAHLDLELKLAKDVYPMVARRRWNVLKAGDGQFITSDRPVALFWDDYSRRDPLGLGLVGTRLLFPLSPKVAICGGLEFSDATLTLDAKRVASVNGRSIMNAGRQVYAMDNSFQYYLPHNHGLRPGTELENDEISVLKPEFKK